MALTSRPFPIQNLYDSIKNEPFKIPEDDGNDLTHTFFNPDREGWLLKLGEFTLSHNNPYTHKHSLTPNHTHTQMHTHTHARG